MLLALSVGASLFAGCSTEDDPLGGNGYEVQLPTSASDLKIEKLSEDEVAKLKSQGLNIVGTPIDVTTKDGECPGVLNELATVSFAIPSDIPKEEYHNLFGVVMDDNGRPVYKVPDSDDLEKGIVTFKTFHFCAACAVMPSESERIHLFIERTAANGWQSNINNDNMRVTFREKLNNLATDLGYGEKDLMGIVMRDILSDNEYLNDALDIIDSDDRASTLADRMKERLLEKSLGVLMEKLKDNPNNPLVKQFFEDHFTKENAQSIAEMVGSGTYPSTWLAKQYMTSYVDDKLKDFSTTILPQIEIVKKYAHSLELIKQFWSVNEMDELYKEYEAFKPSGDGKINDDDWSRFATVRLGWTGSKFGMGLKEMRQMFEDRVKNKSAINKEKSKIEKMIKYWATYLCLNHSYFCNMKVYNEYYKSTGSPDMIQRLTMLHNMTERLRARLVKNGSFSNSDYNVLPVDEELAYIVSIYLDFLSEKGLVEGKKAFEEWLENEKLLGVELKEKVDELDSNRSWWLIRTETNTYENTESSTYVANPGSHFYREEWHGEPEFAYDIWYRPFVVDFEGHCQAPPSVIEGGQTLILESDISVSGPETGHYISDDGGLNFDKEDCPMGFRTIWGIKAEIIDLVGSDIVGSHYGYPKSGSWKFKITIPAGRQGELYAINYSTRGCRTHWVYKWASIFELE